MRKEYLNLFFNALREGRFLYLLRQMAKTGLILPSSWIGKPLVGPIQAILIPTYRCNLRCRMCDLWKRPVQKSQMGERELNTDELCRIIDGYRLIGATGISFTGGEPLLRDDIIYLVGHAKKRGLMAHIATNAVLIDKTMAEELVNSGLDAAIVSLDGPTSSVHDRLRGAEGVFNKAVEGLEALVRARVKSKSKLVITVNCVLTRDNVNKAPDVVRRAASIGIDGVGFMPCQPSGGEGATGKTLRADEPGLKETLEALMSMRREDLNIDNSARYLRCIDTFARTGKSPVKCLVCYHSCVVDCYGDIFPCIPHSNEERPIANVKDIPIEKIWKGARYRKVRKDLKSCRRCYWNCHTEISILCNPLGL